MKLLILLLSLNHASPIQLLQMKAPVLDKTIGLQKELKEIKEQNAKLDRLLKKHSKRKKRVKKPKPILPTIYESKETILIGTVLKGTLQNSIHSTNLESPLIIKVTSGKLVGARLICKGLTTHKRVQTQCSQMVIGDREIGVNIQLLNPDGTAGLVGEYSDRKEEMIEGVLLDSTAQGVLSALSDRVATPFGDTLNRSVKNQLISGSIAGLEASKEIALENSQNLEPIVTISAGTPVLIYFKETLHDL